MPIAETQAVVDRDLNVESLLDEHDANEVMWDIMIDTFKSNALKMQFGSGGPLHLGSFIRSIQIGPTQTNRQRVRLMRRVTEDLLPAHTGGLRNVQAISNQLDREKKEIWNPHVAYIAGRISSVCGWSPDAVSINIFRDHRDYMALHIDSPDLFKRFATVSLGASRELWVRPLDGWENNEKVVVPMESGDLITMQGEDLLGHNLHGIPPVVIDEGDRLDLPYEFASTLDHVAGVRMSLTFYEIAEAHEIPPVDQSLTIVGELYDGMVIYRFATRDLQQAYDYLKSDPKPAYPNCSGHVIANPVHAVSDFATNPQRLADSFMETTISDALD